MKIEPTATITLMVNGITPATTAEPGYLELAFQVSDFVNCAAKYGRKVALEDILTSIFQPMIDVLIGELDATLCLAGGDVSPATAH